jgi:PAS domain S-box-containing protein
LRFSPANAFESQRNVVYDLVSADNVDGLIIEGSLGNFVTPEEFSRFRDRYRPLPMVSLALPQKDIPSVLVDNYEGMRNAIAHLVEVHGRRHVAFIRGPEGNTEAEQRYRAYTDLLAEYDYPLDRDLVTPGDFLSPSGAAALRLLLDERKVDFDALVAANDKMAFGALEVLRARGIRVPDDVAVVGFDDTEEARAVIPSLTTVRQPIYELGKRAVETLLALLAGKEVPGRLVLPTEVVIRRSCGCLTPAVVNARSVHVAAMEQITEWASETVPTAWRSDALSNMVQGMKIPTARLAPEWAGQLLDAFSAELKGESPGLFLSVLDDVLRQVVAVSGDAASLQEMLSALRRHALPYLAGDRETLSRAEELWQQARVMIGEVAQQAYAYQILQAEQQAQTLREIGQTLITTFDMAELVDVLTRELPRLGVPSCYLSLYGGKEAPAETSKLVLAYDRQGPVELEDDGQHFPSRQLVPGGISRIQRRYSMVVEPLYFQKDQLGFVLFEIGPREGTVYDALRTEISSALKGAMLFQEQRRATRLLQALNRAALTMGQALTPEEIFTAVMEEFEKIDFSCAVLLIGNDQSRLYPKYLSYKSGVIRAAEKLTGIKAEEFSIPVEAADRYRRIVREKETVFVEDAEVFTRQVLPEPLKGFAKPIVRMLKVPKFIGAPLIIEDEAVGLFSVQSDDLTGNDVPAITAFAHQIAAAWRKARLVQDLERGLAELRQAEAEARRRAAQAGLIYEVGQRVSGELELETLLSEIVTAVRDAFDYYGVMMMMVDEGNQRLYLHSSAGGYANLFPQDVWLAIGEGMTGYAAATGETQLSGDVSKDPHYVRKTTEETRSELAVPIKSGQSVIAVLDLQSDEFDAFDENDVLVMETLADQIGVAIENARLYEAIERELTERKRAEAERERLLVAEREQRLLAETLTDVTLALTSQISHEVVLDEILRQTRRIVPYDAANIALLEDDSLRIVYWQGYQAFGCEELVANLVQSLTDWPLDAEVVRSRKSLVVPDTRREPRWIKLEEMTWIRSYLAVPVCLRDRTLGLLRLDSAVPGRFILEHARRLQPLASAAAIAIENARLVAGLEAEVEARMAETVAEQAKSEAILRSVGDAILMADRDLRIRYVNPAFTALTGYGTEEVLGRSVNSLGIGTPSEQIEQAKRLALANGESWQGEEGGRRKDGRAYEAAVTIAPLRDPEGHSVGYVYSHRDITQRKNLDRARSRFITNVSHQLRTPVTTVQLYTHLLQEGKQPEKTGDYLQMIKEETERLTHLIRDIIELTALDSGKAVTVWESVFLPDLVENLVTRYQDQAQSSGLTLTSEPLPPNLPAIRGDQARLAQALQEVVENAILFTPPGGQVTVEVGTAEDEDQFWVMIAVRDTGPGMSAEEQERVFDRFYRGRLAESGHIPGTGLGLSIADGILRAHGGKVTVESAVGEGSTFRMWLMPEPHEIPLPQGYNGEPAKE